MGRWGGIYVDCFSYRTSKGKLIWQAFVSFLHIPKIHRRGLRRNSLSMAKKDSVRLAHELLLDCQTSIALELKNFED